MTSLAGAHVLITGGSAGIGYATAARALERGARVSLVARDTERLIAAADELEGSVSDRTRVAAEPADVTNPDMFESALALLVAQFGPVDVLVANAGGARPGHFEELPVSVFREQMELNYFGTLHPIRAVVPSMIERGQGHLMLVSSGAGIVGVYGYSAYSPAKFAVRGLAETLRSELKPHGIVVGCAYPPDTDTPGLVREGETKPAATASISASIKVRSPVAVAQGIVAGIERDRLVVTFDGTTAALARIGGLLGPAVRSTMDRHVRRSERGRANRKKSQAQE
ncbi:MAG: SDR family NAD(P)-dependent oxidoreductase [Acidimicrobiia bacterium]|nr:SDR family NAD(P)-dependent oxidoreductase [Acidimicrobiia bacterium]